MHISNILKKDQIHFSFEFFPPKTEEAAHRLCDAIKELSSICPSFVSVTYGAGGSTKELTQGMLLRLKKETSLNIVAHLTAVGASRSEIRSQLEKYAEAGIENVLAIRGDPPKGSGSFTPAPDGFRYAAEMVSYIKKHFPHFGVGVAGFPEGHPGEHASLPNCYGLFNAPTMTKQLKKLVLTGRQNKSLICTTTILPVFIFIH